MDLLSDPKNKLALAALSSNSIKQIVSSPAARVADQHLFNIHIPVEGSPVTNQRSSGRCWIFASTNCFRVALMKKYDLKEFQLSQAYLFFWDKLEKANYFLENILDTLDEPLDGRLLQTLVASPVGDGGQWDMIVNLVSKYGLVPQTLYPDSQHAKASSEINSLLTTHLRASALSLRHAAEKGASHTALQSLKNDFLKQVHGVLTLTLGPAPCPDDTFTWEYTNRTGTFHSLTTTPKALASQLASPSTIRALGGTDVHRLFSLVHDPRHPPGSHITISRLGNVHAALPIRYANVPMPTIKAAALAMLRRGWPVFFGCDVGKASDGTAGIMDPRLYDYALAFNVQLGLDKAARLRVGESQMTHAMVLTGVHVEEGVAVRWRVENSWSDARGDKGYFVMSDEWMDEFCYQVVVDPAVVPRSVSAILDKEPIVLPLWDPM